MKEPKIEASKQFGEQVPGAAQEREQTLEKSVVASPDRPQTSTDREAYAASTTHTQPVSAAPAARDPELHTIELILADGMDSFFKSLSLQQQSEFKSKGEETAIKIREIMHKSTYRIKEIVSLIIGWLKSLPGVNKFFLEQEAKIKADSIIRQYKK